MRQYFPAHRAGSHPLLSRRITDEEYEQARVKLEEFGLANGWIQE
jgi:putative pyruvate formate lyase activating enzyme